MATANLSDFFLRLTRGMAAQSLGDQSDRMLVVRALAGRDEAAFQAIVERHGPMVYRVAWRVLQHPQDAEDAFQAAFLILAKKLRTLRKHASLSSWLHGVAYRVALKARAQTALRRSHENQAASPEIMPADDLTWGELRLALDAELGRLPDKWRLPLILCYLEGRTQDESASQLGWSKSTLRRRLEEARTALGGRLEGRGIWPAALSAVLLSDCLASPAPAAGVVAATVEAATQTAAISAKVAALVEGVLQAMFMTKLKAATALLFVALGFLIGGGALLHRETNAAQQDTKPQVAQTTQSEKQKATREELEIMRALEELEVAKAKALHAKEILDVAKFEFSRFSKPI